MRSLLRPRSNGALRSLRVQVTVALLLAATACAYLASKASSDELTGAYRDAGQEVLSLTGGGFKTDFKPRQLGDVELLRRRAAALEELHPDIGSAAVSWPKRGDLAHLTGTGGPPRDPRLATFVRSAVARNEPARRSVQTGDGHFAERAIPLDGRTKPAAALVLGYDLHRYDQALTVRNRRVILVLGALLFSFAAFTAFTLGRGIFRPLDRLRAATHEIRTGNLGSRLGWKRRDELGTLGGFDSMASELEEHERLEALALADPLTGLANHRRLRRSWPRTWTGPRQTARSSPSCSSTSTTSSA
jgi:HAMP domain-containing protein